MKTFSELAELQLNKLALFNLLSFSIPGKLKQFVDDLHSGKLHRDFHNMPAEVIIIFSRK